MTEDQSGLGLDLGGERDDETLSDAERVVRWVAGTPLSTIGGLASITTSMPNRIIEAARRAVETSTERATLRRHNRCGIGDPDVCGHPDCPEERPRTEPTERDAEVIRLLTDEERKAVESAQTMTPLTLLMVVDTIKAEARLEGAAAALRGECEQCATPGWVCRVHDLPQLRSDT